MSLRRNKRSPLRVEDLLDLQSSHSSKEGASKRWGGGGGGDEGPFLLQAHELQLGSAAFSHAAQAWLRGLAPHCGRIRALAFCWWDQPGLSPASLQGEPGHLTPLRKSVACNALIYLETTLLSKKKKTKKPKIGKTTEKEQEEARKSTGPANSPNLSSPYGSAPRATPDRAQPPASGPGGGVALTRRHLGRLSRRSVYYSMAARSRPAPPQSLSGGAAAAAAPSLYKPAVPGCEWITMYLSGKPIIINVTPRGSQW